MDNLFGYSFGNRPEVDAHQFCKNSHIRLQLQQSEIKLQRQKKLLSSFLKFLLGDSFFWRQVLLQSKTKWLWFVKIYFASFIYIFRSLLSRTKYRFEIFGRYFFTSSIIMLKIFAMKLYMASITIFVSILWGWPWWWSKKIYVLKINDLWSFMRFTPIISYQISDDTRLTSSCH